MSDIFGCQINDYQHLMKLKEKNLLDSHMRACHAKNQPLNFNIRDSAMGTSYSNDGLTYLINNMQAINTQIQETLYLNYRLDEYVPLKRDVPVGADSYGLKISNSYGQAGFIDGYGSEVSNARTSIKVVSTPIIKGGIMAQWSTTDVEQAAFQGYPLQTDTIKAATNACLDHIEKVGFLGDGSRDMTGLVNNPLVKVWTETTEFQKLPDPTVTINNYINEIILVSNSIFGRNIKLGLTVYLPIRFYNYLATTKYSTDATKSMMDYLKNFNSWTAQSGSPLTFKALLELQNAGKQGRARIMLGFNNSEIMEMANPIMPRVMTIIRQPYAYVAPMEYSISQLNIKHPTGCLYVDFPSEGTFLNPPPAAPDKSKKSKDE